MVSLCKYFYVKYFICTFNQQKDDNDKKKGVGVRATFTQKDNIRHFTLLLENIWGKRERLGKRERERNWKRERERNWLIN